MVCGSKTAEDSHFGGPPRAEASARAALNGAAKPVFSIFFDNSAMPRAASPSPSLPICNSPFAKSSTAHCAVGSSPLPLVCSLFFADSSASLTMPAVRRRPSRRTATCRSSCSLRRRRTATGRATASCPVSFHPPRHTLSPAATVPAPPTSPLPSAPAPFRSCSLRLLPSAPPKRIQYLIAIHHPSAALPTTTLRCNILLYAADGRCGAKFAPPEKG